MGPAFLNIYLHLCLAVLLRAASHLPVVKGEKRTKDHGIYHPEMNSALHGTASCWESV